MPAPRAATPDARCRRHRRCREVARCQAGSRRARILRTVSPRRIIGPRTPGGSPEPPPRAPSASGGTRRPFRAQPGRPLANASARAAPRRNRRSRAKARVARREPADGRRVRRKPASRSLDLIAHLLPGKPHHSRSARRSTCSPVGSRPEHKWLQNFSLHGSAVEQRGALGEATGSLQHNDLTRPAGSTGKWRGISPTYPAVAERSAASFADRGHR